MNNYRQKLNNRHKKIKACSWPVFVEFFHDVDELVGERTDLQQEWQLDKYDQKALDDGNYTEDDHQREVEDVGNSQCQTEKKSEDSNPLAIDTIVTTSHVIFEFVNTYPEGRFENLH